MTVMHATGGGINLAHIRQMTWAELADWWQYAIRLLEGPPDDQEGLDDG